MVCASVSLVVDTASNARVGIEEASFNLFKNFCYDPLVVSAIFVLTSSIINPGVNSRVKPSF